MEFLQPLIDALYKMSLWEASLWLLLENSLIFGIALLGGALLVALFKNRPVCPAVQTNRAEITLALLAVVLNSLVTLAGLVLWQNGWIKLQVALDWKAVLDVFVLFFVMDFAMYILHRIAHLALLFPVLHRDHHRFVNVQPLTLFALNPAEVLGFGALWLLVLLVYPASWVGISVYLTLNVLFGIIGHLGVEPFPPGWLKNPLLSHITTSTFHAGHHQNGRYNLGFYTLIWDKLFGTLDPNYAKSFGIASSLPTIAA